MKLLHTGDLHLGKSLHETSLIEDQKIMLDHLRNELARDDYAALVIAGDVYDRTVPPAEAVELFSGFLVAVRQDFPDLSICIIPGNHDSAQRLSFADRILGRQHIHIICNPEQSFNPIILANGEERIAFFLLPFLAAGTLAVEPRKSAQSSPAEAEPELDFSADSAPILVSQAELAAEASRRFRAILAKKELSGIPSVLVAHLFTLNGRQSESERIFLGNAEQVDPSLFSAFSYVALGHLHRMQRITDRMQYPGSPLAYAFDEAGTEKIFLKVEIDCATPGFPVTVTPLPVNPFRKVARLSGAFSDFYTGTGFDGHATEYLEITLTDVDLVANPMNLLRPKFPWLISLKQGVDGGANGALLPDGTPAGSQKPGDTDTSSETRRDPVEDFNRFESLINGTPDPEKTKLFAELLAECADET